MLGLLVRVGVIAAVAGFGWVWGSVFPAPSWLIEKVDPRGIEQRALARLKGVNLETITASLSPAQVDALKDNAVKAAADAGSIIAVEEVSPEAVQQQMALTTAQTPTVARVSTTSPGTPAVAGTFETSLSLCPRMTIQNAPPAANLRVSNFAPTFTVQGVTLATNPTRGACLSSGFGDRNGRTHKGVDYHSETGGPILAAGDGVVVEKKYRDDYGNMLLIDHGSGVYTRYAHLSSFSKGLKVGDKVRAGDGVGLMGNTASYAIPVHLHYEVLLGDYANPKASFGLKPTSPFSRT